MFASSEITVAFRSSRTRTAQVTSHEQRILLSLAKNRPSFSRMLPRVIGAGSGGHDGEPYGAESTGEYADGPPEGAYLPRPENGALVLRFPAWQALSRLLGAACQFGLYLVGSFAMIDWRRGGLIASNSAKRAVRPRA